MERIEKITENTLGTEVAFYNVMLPVRLGKLLESVAKQGNEYFDELVTAGLFIMSFCPAKEVRQALITEANMACHLTAVELNDLFDKLKQVEADSVHADVSEFKCMLSNQTQAKLKSLSPDFEKQGVSSIIKEAVDLYLTMKNHERVRASFKSAVKSSAQLVDLYEKWILKAEHSEPTT